MDQDFLNQLCNPDQFKAGGGSFINVDDLVRKIIRHGDNRYRQVGPGRFFFTHNWKAKNGTWVTSVCPKSDLDEGETNDCPKCAQAGKAWEIFNEFEKSVKENRQCAYANQEIVAAKIFLGKMVAPGEKYSNNEAARKMILIQGLDRDTDVCQRNKHLALLCKDEYGLGITAARNGIWEPISGLYNRHRAEIQKHMEQGPTFNWLPFDIILIKSGKNLDTKYERERCESEALTEEELGFERYDLPELTKVTPLEVVQRWIDVGTKSGKKSDDAGESGNSDSSEGKTSSSPNSSSQSNKPAESGDNAEATGTTDNAPSQSDVAPPPSQSPNSDDVEKANCPSCDKLIPTTSTSCPECNCEFEGYEAEAETTTEAAATTETEAAATTETEAATEPPPATTAKTTKAKTAKAKTAKAKTTGKAGGSKKKDGAPF